MSKITAIGNQYWKTVAIYILKTLDLELTPGGTLSLEVK